MPPAHATWTAAFPLLCPSASDDHRSLMHSPRMAANTVPSPDCRIVYARRGWPALLALALAVAALCAVAPLRPSAGRLFLQPPAATAAAAASEPGCRPAVLATFTSHKTGTAQAGCLVAVVLKSARRPMAHFYENAATSPHAVVKFAAAVAAHGEQAVAAPRVHSCVVPAGTLPCNQMLARSLLPSRHLPLRHRLHRRRLPAARRSRALPLPLLPLRLGWQSPLRILGWGRAGNAQRRCHSGPGCAQPDRRCGVCLLLPQVCVHVWHAWLRRWQISWLPSLFTVPESKMQMHECTKRLLQCATSRHHAASYRCPVVLQAGAGAGAVD